MQGRARWDRAPAWWKVLPGVLGLLLIGSLLAFWAASLSSHHYLMWLNGRYIGESRNLESLLTAAESRWESDRGRRVILVTANRQWDFRLADLGYGGPIRPIREAAREQIAPRNLWEWLTTREVPIHLNLRPDWDMERLGSALAPVEAAVEREPVPARLEIQNHQPVIIPEQPGLTVERGALLILLEVPDLPPRIEVPLRQQQPTTTRESLAAMRIRVLLAEYSTRYDPTVPRAHNVEKAAAAFNGMILKPGQILSANATIGPVSLATGWKEAPVIEGGVLVPGVGGGVCQVATTLYGAALRANLEIVERHPHQLVVSYVTPSQDAAIAQGWEDLKLRNNTLGHLLVESESNDGVLTFRLYGDRPEGLDVRIESRVTGSTPYGSKTVEDAALLPDQKMVRSQGIPGTLSEAYRLVYQHGQLIRRELLSRDSYLPVAEVILVGPKPAEESKEKD